VDVGLERDKDDKIAAVAGQGAAVAASLGQDPDEVAVFLRHYFRHVDAADVAVEGVEEDHRLVGPARRRVPADDAVAGERGVARLQQPAVVAGGPDQHPGEGDEAGEALGPDGGVAAPVGSAPALGLDHRPV